MKAMQVWDLSITENISNQIIWLTDNDYAIAIKLGNLLYCESISKPNEYTNVYFLDNAGKLQHLKSSIGIGKWDFLLWNYRFLRIHRGFLVNYNFIQKYSRREGKLFLAHTKQPLPVSKSGKQKLVTLINNF